MTEKQTQIPVTLDYLVFLQTRLCLFRILFASVLSPFLAEIDDERKDWISLFEETQIEPDLALKRNARYEKRRFELESIQKEYGELVRSAEKSHDAVSKMAQENEQLKCMLYFPISSGSYLFSAQLNQDEANIKTLAQVASAVGPGLAYLVILLLIFSFYLHRYYLLFRWIQVSLICRLLCLHLFLSIRIDYQSYYYMYNHFETILRFCKYNY